MTEVKLGAALDIDELTEIAADYKTGDLLVLGCDTKMVKPDKMGEWFAELEKCFKKSGERPFLALYMFGEVPPWEDAWSKVWAKEFVEKHMDKMSLLVDEISMSRGGSDMVSFPGVGRVRLLTLAGNGDMIKQPDGGVQVKLNNVGHAMLQAIRGDTFGAS